ncbi:uncharacterized protein [Procambarus clarkii]|uniref:uncharacterized protein n=1 Tax=Procambarus clarkii TaxID=6728 RepID=UPI003743A779
MQVNAGVWYMLPFLLYTFHSAGRVNCATRKCSMSAILNSTTGISTQNLPDYIVTGNARCAQAAIRCPLDLLNHLMVHLGSSLAPISGDAAQKLCTLFKQEVTHANQGRVFVQWSADKCPNTNGTTYLGNLCCWKYDIGSTQTYIPNAGCQDTVKPTAQIL